MLGQEIQGDPKQCIWNFEKVLSLKSCSSYSILAKQKYQGWCDICLHFINCLFTIFQKSATSSELRYISMGQ